MTPTAVRAPRTWRPGTRLRLPAHRASSMMLAGAYPFLAPTPPAAGTYIGTDALTGSPFSFDPWALYAGGWLSNPNVLLAGVIGQGKSALAKTLALRSVAAGRRVYVPGDPKGEWAAVAHAVGGTVMALGPGLPARLNPLDADPNDPGAVAGRARLLASLAETTLQRALRPVEYTAIEVALTTAAARSGALTLPSVLDALNDPDARSRTGSGESANGLRDGSADLAHCLRRLVSGDLAGMFDGPSTHRLDPDAPMVVLDLSGMNTDDDATAIAMTCASTWLQSAIADGTGHRWIIYDEAWRLLHCLPLVRRMQSQWKLSRAYGVANLMVLHRLSDLDGAGADGGAIRTLAEGLLADCSTRIVYRQETDQLPAAVTALGLTGPERELLPALPRGTGLWRLPGRSYVVHHRLHRDELAIIDTDAAMRGKAEKFEAPMTNGAGT